MYDFNNTNIVIEVATMIEEQLSLASFEDAELSPSFFNMLYNTYPYPVIQEAISKYINDELVLEQEIFDLEHDFIEEGLGKLATRIITKPFRAAGKYAGQKVALAWDNSVGAKLRDWDKKIDKWINSKSSTLGKHTERFMAPVLTRMVKDYRNSNKLVDEVRSSNRKTIASLDKIKKITQNNSDSQLIRILVAGLGSTSCIDYSILGKHLISKGREGISVNAVASDNPLRIYSDLANTDTYKSAEKLSDKINILVEQTSSSNIRFMDAADMTTDLDEYLKDKLKNEGAVKQFKKELGTWTDEWEKYNLEMKKLIGILDAHNVL